MKEKIRIWCFLTVFLLFGCGKTKKTELQEVEFRVNPSLLSKQQLNIGKSNSCVSLTKNSKSKIKTNGLEVLTDSALEISTVFIDSAMSSHDFLSKIAGQPTVILENDSFLLKGQTIRQRFLQAGKLVAFEIKFNADTLSSRMLILFEAKSRDKGEFNHQTQFLLKV